MRFNGYVYDSMSPVWLKKLIKDNESKWLHFSEEELIRWLYIELGERFSFSREYRYAITPEEKARIELQAKDKVMRTRRVNNVDSVICIDIEETMQMLLTDLFGIDSRVITDGSGPHVYLEVRTENYGRIKLDLQEDLVNIKSGRRTEHFGSENYYNQKDYMTIPEGKIKEIDKKIGYIDENEKYMEDYLEDYRDKIEQSDTTDEKVRKVFALLEYKFSEILKSMKYCERTEIYKKVIEDMLPYDKVEHRTFRNNGKLLSCFIVPDDSDEDNKKYFLFNKEKRSYEEIDREEYEKLYDCNEETIKQVALKAKDKSKFD